MAKTRDFTWTPKELSSLLGEEAAERTNADRLLTFFFRGSAFHQLASNAQIRVLVAHKGIGKTALLKAASHEIAKDTTNTIVSVVPESVNGIPVTADGNFVRMKTEWKEGLRGVIAETLCRGFGILDDALIRMISGGARSAPQFLTSAVQPALTEQPIDKGLDETVRKAIDAAIREGKVFVFMDDLDYGWAHSQGHERDIQRIASLFAAIMELATEQDSLHFRIAMRSEIHYLVRTAYIDVDRLRDSFEYADWSTPKEILAVFAKRALTYQRDHLNAAARPEFSLDDQRLLALSADQLATHLLLIVEHKFRVGSLWGDRSVVQVMMTLIRQRPRDLILLIELAAKQLQVRIQQATDQRGKVSRITGEDILQVLPSYSEYLLDELTTEHRAQFPALRSFIEQFAARPEHLQKGKGFVFTKSELEEGLWGVCSLAAFKESDHQFAPAAMSQYKTFAPQQLTHFLYKIGFLAIRLPSQSNKHEVVRRYYDVRHFNDLAKIDSGDFLWEIHPAFWWALAPAHIAAKDALHDLVIPVDMSAVCI